MSKEEELINRLSFHKTPGKTLVSEEYLLRAKSSVPNRGNIEVFKNPSVRDLKTTKI